MHTHCPVCTNVKLSRTYLTEAFYAKFRDCEAFMTRGEYYSFLTTLSVTVSVQQAMNQSEEAQKCHTRLLGN